MPKDRSNSAVPRPAFSISTTPGTPNSSIARRSRSRTSSRLSNMSRLSPTYPQPRPLQKRLHFLPGDPIKITGDRVLEGTRRDAIIKSLLQVAVQEAVNQAGSKGIARTQAVNDLYLVRP